MFRKIEPVQKNQSSSKCLKNVSKKIFKIEPILKIEPDQIIESIQNIELNQKIEPVQEVKLTKEIKPVQKIKLTEY